MSRFLYKRGVLSLSDLFFCVRTYLYCLIRHRPLNDLHSRVFERLFHGKPLEQFASHVADFISMRLSKMLYTPALLELQKWKQKGARLVLLSGSPDFLVKPIARALGLREAHGSEYNVDGQGCLVGLKRLLDGQWKADFLKAEASRSKAVQSIAYSDHILDLPLLEFVKLPIVVNPERRLRKLARRRGWKIL